MDENEIILTDNGKATLRFLQENDKEYVGIELMRILGFKSMSAFTSLYNKGLLAKGTPAIRDFTNNKGETKPKEYLTYHLTDAGSAYIL